MALSLPLRTRLSRISQLTRASLTRLALGVALAVVARARSLRWWLDVAAVGFVLRVTWILARPLTFSAFGYDERFYVYGGYSVLHGQVPYRDFQNLKGPLVSLSEALAIALFGLSDQRFRLFPAILGVGAIVLFVAALIQRGVLRLVAIAIGLLVVALWLDPTRHETSVNDTESLLVGYFFVAIACLSFRVRRSAALSLLGGLFLGATVLVKENFVITAAAAWLAFLVAPRAGPHAREQRVSYAIWSLAGGLGLGVAMVLYLAVSGGLRPYVHLISVYPRYANSYCTQLGLFHPGPFWDVRRQEWEALGRQLLNFPMMGPWLPLVAATFVLTTWRTVPYVAACTLTFVGALTTINVGHCYWNHYFVLAATGLAVWTLPGADALSLGLRGARRSLKVWAGLLAAVWIVVGLDPRYDQAAEARPRPVRRVVAPDVLDAIDAFSKPGDYVLTTGTPELYYLTRRLGAHETNGFVDELLTMYPGDTDAERVSGMRARLEKTQPKVIVIDTSASAYAGRSARTIHALVDAYVDAHHYVRIGRMWVRPDVAGDAATRPPIHATSGEVVSDVRP